MSRIESGEIVAPRRVNARGRGRDRTGRCDMAKRTCSIDGCERLHLSRGWCARHYQRWRKFGDPLGAVPLADGEARFWAKVAIGSPDVCWEWQAGSLPDGYGTFHLGGRDRRAHRVAYELRVGVIPAGQHVLHRCDNPSCVNPAHLFLGTHADNMKDMAAKGRGLGHRGPRGERNARSTLNESQVRAIRWLCEVGNSQRAVSRLFGVSQGHVSDVVNGKRWAHVA